MNTEKRNSDPNISLCECNWKIFDERPHICIDPCNVDHDPAHAVRFVRAFIADKKNFRGAYLEPGDFTTVFRFVNPKYTVRVRPREYIVYDDADKTFKAGQFVVRPHDMRYGPGGSLSVTGGDLPEKPTAPMCRIITDGGGPLFGEKIYRHCGSTIKTKFWFWSSGKCIQPKCDNYYGSSLILPEKEWDRE